MGEVLGPNNHELLAPVCLSAQVNPVRLNHPLLLKVTLANYLVDQFLSSRVP